MKELVFTAFISICFYFCVLYLLFSLVDMVLWHGIMGLEITEEHDDTNILFALSVSLLATGYYLRESK